MHFASQHVGTLPVACLLKTRLLVPALLQGYWAEGGSWWPATLDAVLGGGRLQLRVDPTPAHKAVRAPCEPLVRDVRRLLLQRPALATAGACSLQRLCRRPVTDWGVTCAGG